jgi:hypothetical protein
MFGSFGFVPLLAEGAAAGPHGHRMSSTLTRSATAMSRFVLGRGRRRPFSSSRIDDTESPVSFANSRCVIGKASRIAFSRLAGRRSPMLWNATSPVQSPNLGPTTATPSPAAPARPATPERRYRPRPAPAKRSSTLRPARVPRP